MHCPRCGQKQISPEIKFCSRCGFPLGLVSEILAHGGFLPQLADLYKTKSKFTRRNGLIFSLFWFLFFVLIMTPFWGIVDVDELAGMSAILGIFGGLMIFLASFFFLKNPPKENPAMLNEPPSPNAFNIHNTNSSNALPPRQSVPVDAYVPPAAGSWKAPETGDLQPRSVIENTTKLLNKDK
jgi:uncharacterized protein with PQ loop repeat